jgi:hypothetical protein
LPVATEADVTRWTTALMRATRRAPTRHSQA